MKSLNLTDLVVYEVFARAYSNKVGKQFEIISEDLERIKSLGANCVWFMPIHPAGVLHRKGELGSPYAIKDYYEIDPLIGTKQGFRRLIKRAHQLNMKVLMDMVLNHTSMDSVLYNTHPEWFMRDENGNSFRKVSDWSDIVDLDYSHHDLREYMIDMMTYWVKEFDIDGFRCDVAGLVPLDFWIEARSQLDKLKALTWISESHDSYMYQAFDITYDYDGYYKFLDYLKNRISLQDYVNFIRMQDHLYPYGYVKMRFLENHDQDRIKSKITDDTLLRNWVAYYILIKGVPLIYNAQEYGIPEKPDIFNKYVIPWVKESNEWFDFYREILLFRSRTACVRQGQFSFFVNDAPEEVITFGWHKEGACVIAVLNMTKTDRDSVTIKLEEPFVRSTVHALNVLRKLPEHFSVSDQKITVKIRKEPTILSYRVG